MLVKRDTDSFEYSPPINFASERETPTNAYSIRWRKLLVKLALSLKLGNTLV